MNIRLPDEVQFILNTLENAGYEAYAVGGCIRDSLLGKEPKDWDICTSALPEQTMSRFIGEHIIETGLQHGTITLMLNHNPYEITTYRVDGHYSDSRRPDKVEFVSDLRADLSRRDFTINSLAYNPRTGIVDLFGGAGDLKKGVINCVGDANSRFLEDVLRILRALRFASELGFTIGADTAKAMHGSCKRLTLIAVERIASELNRLLLGDGVRNVLLEYIDVIEVFMPEITPSIGFIQNNPYHCYDVLNHTLYSIENATKDLVVRLTMLFHDIGKPSCYSESEDGVGHFYGHAQASADMARDILTRLKYDNNTIKAVVQLVLYHDCEIKRRQHIKRWLNKIGEERLRQLIEVKKADALAQAVDVRQERIDALNNLLVLTDEIIAQRQCFSLKDLAVNGRDLIDAGVPEGTMIGVILNRIMDMVINEEAENDKAVLLDIVRIIPHGGTGIED